MIDNAQGYGPTKNCEPNCKGCSKCARVFQLVAEIRAGNHDAACELANRVEALMGDGTIDRATAGGWIRSKLEPVPAVVVDALVAACDDRGPEKLSESQ